jgi:hypothetical protein
MSLLQNGQFGPILSLQSVQHVCWHGRNMKLRCLKHVSQGQRPGVEPAPFPLFGRFPSDGASEKRINKRYVYLNLSSRKKVVNSVLVKNWTRHEWYGTKLVKSQVMTPINILCCCTTAVNWKSPSKFRLKTTFSFFPVLLTFMLASLSHGTSAVTDETKQGLAKTD